MSSIIKVNTYQDANGNALFSSDGSGNVTLSSSDMKATPAFHAYGSGSDQTIGDNVNAKITVFNTELFDTDNCFSSNRFTPTTAGKYYVYAHIYWDTASANDFHDGAIKIYKNGSNIKQINCNYNASGGNARAEHSAVLVDMNGSTDYIEIYCYQNTNSGNSINVSATQSNASFGGYRIIGA